MKLNLTKLHRINRPKSGWLKSRKMNIRLNELWTLIDQSKQSLPMERRLERSEFWRRKTIRELFRDRRWIGFETKVNCRKANKRVREGEKRNLKLGLNPRREIEMKIILM